MQKQTEIFYLEMNSPGELHRKDSSPIDLRVEECLTPQWELNKFLYSFIGRKWLWFDKLNHNDEQWKEYVESENMRTWVAYDKGAIAGYFELIKHGADVEIIYFGLSGKYIEKGIGGYLLTKAVDAAWNWQAERVILNTCTLDHPKALDNYKSRGFKVYKSTIRE